MCGVGCLVVLGENWDCLPFGWGFVWVGEIVEEGQILDHSFKKSRKERIKNALVNQIIH